MILPNPAAPALGAWNRLSSGHAVILQGNIGGGHEVELSFEIFLQERNYLLAYVRRVAPGLDSVDVLQEVGLRLLRRPDAPTQRDDVLAWCKAVARHVILHERRAARYEREKLAAFGLALTTDAWEPERRATLRSTMVRQLEQIDQFSRELLLRRYVLEQTSNEIARETKMSAAAVRMRLMRIRDDLGRHLRPAL